MLAQGFQRAAELPGTGLADGVVERDDEACLRDGDKPALDQIPRLEIVRQIDGAEIVAERCADAGCHGQHGGDAWNDRQLDVAPCPRAGLDGLADGGCHSKDAGVAPRDNSNVVTACRHIEGGVGARDLLAVVGGDAGLVRAQLKPVEIGLVAEEMAGFRDRAAGFRRDLVRIAGAEADDDEAAAQLSAPGLPAQPGTSTIAK